MSNIQKVSCTTAVLSKGSDLLTLNGLQDNAFRGTFCICNNHRDVREIKDTI